MRVLCSVALMILAFGLGLSATMADEDPNRLLYIEDDVVAEYGVSPTVETVLQAQTGNEKKQSGKGSSKGKKKQTTPRVIPPTITPTPALTTRSRQRRTRRTASSRSRSMSNVPEMFGDIFGTAARLDVVTTPFSFPSGFTSTDLIGGGGSRRVKAGENNRSLPTDRFVFQYNHFHNAGSFVASGAATNDFPIDRYTFGVEKTFFDEQWSLELRLPFTGFNGAGGVGPAGPTSVQSGAMGNLHLILKHILLEGDTGVLAAGVGIDTPTGSDTTVNVSGSVLTLENQAFHLAPYLGLSLAPIESCFINFFAQVDFALNGNSVDLDIDATGPMKLGSYNDQNLLYLDIGAGHWFYQDPDAERITGIAGLVELHYTSAIQDMDGVVGIDGINTLLLSSTVNRFDVLNLTAGIHVEVAETSLFRIAAVVPVTGNGLDNRFFDAEIQAVFNRRF